MLADTAAYAELAIRTVFYTAERFVSATGGSHVPVAIEIQIPQQQALQARWQGCDPVVLRCQSKKQWTSLQSRSRELLRMHSDDDVLVEHCQHCCLYQPAAVWLGVDGH